MTAADRPATVTCPWCGAAARMTGPGVYLCPESAEPTPRPLEYDRRMARRVAELPQGSVQ